ncbi:hypothetical protein [Enterobacter hormaechei]|uniref:hypothetical protein n=1 Tax=Enterobacter hormaechei TaxID=158836 RepID=UPI002E18A4B8|nr:hypothetical protein [Enterobacter hormaechei]
MAIKSFDYVDYSKVFRTQVPQSNLLLTHLNVFADRQITDSHKVSVDRIQEASIGVDAPLMRFSSEWGLSRSRPLDRIYTSLYGAV